MCIRIIFTNLKFKLIPPFEHANLIICMVTSYSLNFLDTKMTTNSLVCGFFVSIYIMSRVDDSKDRSHFKKCQQKAQ